MQVPTEVLNLTARNKSGRPLVSMASSGIGGANGHAVIEGPPLRVENATEFKSQAPILVLAGGLSPRSALQVAVDLDILARAGKHDLRTIASIYGRRARQMTWRAHTIWKPGMSKLEFPQPRLVPRSKPPLVFVFSGQGPQHIASMFIFTIITSVY